MATNSDSKKRYFWIKLKEDFFDLPTIDFLQEQKNGCEHIVLYLRLCLIAANTEGRLVRQIGGMVIPYDAKKISDVTKIKFDTVAVALDAFRKIGLIEERPDGVLTIPSIGEMVGSETKGAMVKRLQREKIKVLASSTPLQISSASKTNRGQRNGRTEDAGMDTSRTEKGQCTFPVHSDVHSNERTSSIKILDTRDREDDDYISRTGAGACARDYEENGELARVMAEYQDNIHPISSQIERDRIIDLVNTYGAKWVTEAIHRSAINHAGTVRYVEAVLEGWRSSGKQEPWREDRKNGRYTEKHNGNAARETRPNSRNEDGIDWSQYDNTYDFEPPRATESTGDPGIAGEHGDTQN